MPTPDKELPDVVKMDRQPGDLGVTMIDEQHREIFRRVNRLS